MRFSICQRSSRAVGDVIDEDKRGDPTADRHGFRRSRKKVVQGPALIRLDVREGDVAKPIHGQNFDHRLTYPRKHAPGTRVEQERVVARDQVLVEVERTWTIGSDDSLIDAVDARGNIVNAGAGIRAVTM